MQQLATLPAASVQCCVTSPPYWGLRDYGTAGQLGLEAPPDEYVANMVAVFRAVRRVLRDDGTLWLNLGDCYYTGGKGGAEADAKRIVDAGSKQATHTANAFAGAANRREIHGMKPKDLVGIPWRVAFALQADGWYLRQDIIWHKPNPMPESVTDRCTKAHEYIFLLSKSPKYYYDADAVKEPCATNENRPSGVVREREFGYDSKRNNNPAAFMVVKSGNKERKQRPGADTLNIGAQAGSIPWEGSTRNKRSVWTVTTKPFRGAHFATFPPALIEPCILAGSAADTLVLDPFSGAGTTGLVAVQHGRRYIGIELNQII